MTQSVPGPQNFTDKPVEEVGGLTKSPPPGAAAAIAPGTGGKAKKAMLGLEAAPPSPKSSAQTAAAMVLLRDLSAEMLDLQTVLQKIENGEDALGVVAPYVSKTVTDVNALVTAIGDSKAPLSSDSVRHILNTWELMQTNPLLLAPDGDHSTQDQMRLVKALLAQIDKVVYQCGTLTIPERLAEWMDKTRVGYYIPFHDVFADEMPNADDRGRLLKYLAWAPRLIQSGYVDMDAGLVYRYSRNHIERWLSVLYLVIGVVLVTGLVVGACYLAVPGWPLTVSQVTPMLTGWVALLVGVLVHIGVGSIKHTRDQGGLPAQFLPGDVLFVVNARLGQILLKLLIALIGLFGLMFTAGAGQVTVFNSFLVGYSLDSVVEMFGSSLEKRAAGQVSALQENLGGE